MDFFSESPPPKTDDSESAEPSVADSSENSSATLRKRVHARARKPQLLLGLQSLPLNKYSWSDQQICKFRDAMLVHEVRALADERTSPELRAELIAWIAAPMRSLEELKLAPFSFQACCYSVGVDFQEMRERTLAMFAPNLIKQLR